MVVASPITGAAVIGGELILSLPTGQIINCGLVQGPPGLKGEPGAPGPTGKAGLDGNTLLNGQGFPALDIGRDGDFYWMTGPDLAVFGPKIGGSWGTPVYLKQPIVGVNADAVPMAMAGGEGGGSGGDGPSKVYTNQVIASGAGRSGRLKSTKAGVSYTGSPNGIIPPSGELHVQSNINSWIVSALERFDDVVPVGMGGILPAAGDYDGDLFYAGDSLFIWSEEHGWQAISAGDDGPPVFVGDSEPPGVPQAGELWYSTKETDLTLFIHTGTAWVPAAPPVSLDGIESSITGIEGDLIELHNNVRQVKGDVVLTNQDLQALAQDYVSKTEDNYISGKNEFDQPVVVAPGTKGHEAITFEQLANLAGEIDEIKDEKEKGEWVAELPSAGSEGGREVHVNAPTFPEAQGGSNMMQLKEAGGPDGFGQLSILIDPGAQDDENKALQRWLKDAAAECTADSDTFRDKYSFFCPEAEEKGFAVRDQPIYAIEDPSLTTFKIKFYGKPNTGEKEDSIVGVEFFQEGAEGHRPASGKFFMEAYQDKSAQEEACNEAFAECQTGDPTNDSRCLRELDTCLDNAKDGFKPVSDFGEATAIIFNKTDAKMPAVTHSFDEVRIGDSISITDKKTGHFIVAEIDVIQQVGDHIRFTIDTVSHSGGIVDGNKCSVEFYDFNLTPEGPNLDQFVKKTGDKMTGTLENTGKIWIRPGGKGANGANNMLVVNQQDAGGGSIARFQQNANDVLKIEYDRTINVVDNRITRVGAPEKDTDAANKEYVDTKIEKGGSNILNTIPANLVLWEYVEGGESVKWDLSSNKFSVETSGDNVTIYVSVHAQGRFYVAGSATNYSHELGHTYSTINEYDSSCVLGFKATKLWLMQFKNINGKNCYYNAIDGSYFKSGLSAHSLVAGRRYALNLPSPFPLFSYSKDYFLNGTPATETTAIDGLIDEVEPGGIDHGEILE